MAPTWVEALSPVRSLHVAVLPEEDVETTLELPDQRTIDDHPAAWRCGRLNRTLFHVLCGIWPRCATVRRIGPAVGLALVVVFAAFAASAPVLATPRGHERRRPVDALIIHSLGGPDCRDGRVFYKQIDGDADEWVRRFAALPGVSIHYVIGRDGTVATGISESLAASHAIGWNQRSIGIELVNNGDNRDPFPRVQFDALVRLAREIRRRHPAIALARVLRHSDVDHTNFPAAEFGAGCTAFRRKLDPGDAFPWDEFKRALATPD